MRKPLFYVGDIISANCEIYKVLPAEEHKHIADTIVPSTILNGRIYVNNTVFAYVGRNVITKQIELVPVSDITKGWNLIF